MENLSLLYAFVLFLVKRLDFFSFFFFWICWMFCWLRFWWLLSIILLMILCLFHELFSRLLRFLQYSSISDMIIFFNCHDFQAAHYLEIQGLLDLTCQRVADILNENSVEKIREIFHIKNDFTPEEEAEERSKIQWAFEWNRETILIQRKVNT